MIFMCVFLLHVYYFRGSLYYECLAAFYDVFSVYSDVQQVDGSSYFSGICSSR